MAELSDIRETVRERYAAAARAASSVTGEGCCGSELSCSPADATGVFGATLYDEAAGGEAPEAALSASLGCGVPTAVADLAEGETVLDLGSGAGADVLISARRVGPTGKAIGLDMTDEMLELARANAAEAGVKNVAFLKGYLEEMPIADASVDVVISNCVINLVGDKAGVIREAARVLRPGGRFAVSDVIADPDMDEATRADMAAWTGCVTGALTEAEFRTVLRDAGLEQVEIRETHRVHEHAAAAIIRAQKPVASGAEATVSLEPSSTPDCKLDSDQLGVQLGRYRGLARHVLSVERRPGEVVAHFGDDPPAGLVEQTLEVERRCCPFIHAAYHRAARRLTLTVKNIDQEPTLDVLYDALR
jgi:arsenite methyltransferase